jgi:hypothetical protein
MVMVDDDAADVALVANEAVIATPLIAVIPIIYFILFTSNH